MSPYEHLLSHKISKLHVLVFVLCWLKKKEKEKKGDMRDSKRSLLCGNVQLEQSGPPDILCFPSCPLTSSNETMKILSPDHHREIMPLSDCCSASRYITAPMTRIALQSDDFIDVVCIPETECLTGEVWAW